MTKKTELITVPTADALGNPIQVPPWYPGSPEDFAIEVSKLTPDMCSWPNGALPHPGGRRCCTNRKTRAGVCVEHLGSLIPSVHGKDMTKEHLAHVVNAIRDPRLSELTINTFYAEENLERAAKKCRDGGLSTRNLDLLQSLLESLNGSLLQYRMHQQDIVSARAALEDSHDDAERRRITEGIRKSTRALMEAFDEVEKTCVKMKKVEQVARNDERNWKALTDANAASVDIKKQVAQVEALKKDQLSVEEVQNSFTTLIETIEEVIRAEAPKATANRIMEQIYQRALQNNGSF